MTRKEIRKKEDKVKDIMSQQMEMSYHVLCRNCIETEVTKTVTSFISIIKCGGISDELENFQKPGKNGDGDIASLSTLFANRKKRHYVSDRFIKNYNLLYF